MQQLVEIDLGALFWFQSIHSPWLDPLMQAITYLGDRWLMLGLLLAAFLCCLYVRAWRTGFLLLAVFGLAYLVTEAAKIGVNRPRPDVAHVLGTRSKTGSFPSGHAILSAVVYGSLAVAVGRRLSSRSAAVLLALGTVILVMAIGFSRLYLGVHFVTDVVGGWVVGGALVLLFLWADQPTSAGTRATTTRPEARTEAFAPGDFRVHSDSGGSSFPESEPESKPGWWRRPASGQK